MPGGSTLIPASVLGQFNAVDGAVERCLLQAGVQLAEESVVDALEVVLHSNLDVEALVHVRTPRPMRLEGRDLRSEPLQAVNGDNSHAVIVPCHIQLLHVVLVALPQR